MQIDSKMFVARDAAGVPAPVKLKFATSCHSCQQAYVTTLECEKQKKNPWFCKSCAIKEEWKDPTYRGAREVGLKASARTSRRRNITSQTSKNNWNDPLIRQRMLDKDNKAIGAKSASTRKRNVTLGKVYPTAHGKHTQYAGVWMKSSYEERFAKALDAAGVTWQYESKSFLLRALDRVYTPDFYIPALGLFVEVKGWWRDDAYEKFKACVLENPDTKFALVMGDDLESFEINKRPELLLERICGENYFEESP
jgi:hypothetical protein